MKLDQDSFLTHARPGTKGFNVDLYSRDRGDDVSFTFFVDVPGYEPDHSDAFFEALYTADQLQDLTRDELRFELARKLNSEHSVNEGYPVNGVVIGTGADVLKALIRAGWHENPRTPAEKDAELSTFDGRIADVVFIRNERKGGERNELRFWKSPFLEAGVPVWMLQSVHYIGVGGGTMDPDIDDAILYLLQDIWYGQGLARFAWLRIDDVPTGVLVPVRATKDSEYFTSGTVLVSWLSGDLLSMLEVDLLTWDPSPTGSLE